MGSPGRVCSSRRLNGGPLNSAYFAPLTRPSAPRLIRSAAAAWVLLLALGWAAHAQGPEPRIVPRGQLVVGASALLHRTDAVYSPGEPLPLGSRFFIPIISSTAIPELGPIETQIQSLGGTSPPSLVLGSTVGRLSLEDDIAPLALRYGLTDRITVGAMLPIVRRRVDALLRYTPAGANVGRSPFATNASSVTVFLSQAGASFAQTSSAVDGYCGGAGELDAQCVSGRALVQSASDFLSTLDDLYTGSSPFALVGTDFGNAVTATWGTLTQGFVDWGAPNPGAAPLATEDLTDAEFRQLVVAPAWSPFGLPARTAAPFFDMGDLEIQGAIRLLGPPPSGVSTGPDPEGDARLLVDLAVTLRLPTGSPDSLRALAPTGTQRGVLGVELVLAGDLRAGSRVSLGWMGEGGWHGSRDGILVAPDPARPFSPGHTRTRVSWSPGGHLRVALAPRFHLAPALSVAGRWEMIRQAADTFAPIDDPSPALPVGSTRTAHALGFELRFDGLRPPATSTIGRPFSAFLRMSRTVSGSDGAPIVHSLEGGIALAIRALPI